MTLTHPCDEAVTNILRELLIVHQLLQENAANTHTRTHSERSDRAPDILFLCTSYFLVFIITENLKKKKKKKTTSEYKLAFPETQQNKGTTKCLKPLNSLLYHPAG